MRVMRCHAWWRHVPYSCYTCSCMQATVACMRTSSILFCHKVLAYVKCVYYEQNNSSSVNDNMMASSWWGNKHIHTNIHINACQNSSGVLAMSEQRPCSLCGRARSGSSTCLRTWATLEYPCGARGKWRQHTYAFMAHGQLKCRINCIQDSYDDVTWCVIHIVLYVSILVIGWNCCEGVMKVNNPAKRFHASSTHSWVKCSSYPGFIASADLWDSIHGFIIGPSTCAQLPVQDLYFD